MNDREGKMWWIGLFMVVFVLIVVINMDVGDPVQPQKPEPDLRPSEPEEGAPGCLCITCVEKMESK